MGVVTIHIYTPLELTYICQYFTIDSLFVTTQCQNVTHGQISVRGMSILIKYGTQFNVAFLSPYHRYQIGKQILFCTIK